MEKFFKLKENRTTVSTEVIAGITTFMTMAYILVVNPDILQNAGMSWGSVFTATVLASCAATVVMALLANYPFALAPGMGLNAFFAFTVVISEGHSWQVALLAVFVEGILFLLLSFVNLREAIFNAVPKNLKYAVSVGIGIFICFVGLQNAKIIVPNGSTLVALTPSPLGDVRVVLALLGLILTGTLVARKVKGALLWGILGTYLVGIICQLMGWYVPDPAAGLYSLFPSGVVTLPPSIAEYNLISAFSSGNFANLNILDFVVIVFAFLFVDVFDTIGTLIGVSGKANMLDKDGKLPRIKEALLADAVGTTVGAVLGTSTVTTYIESAAGVTEGGRTGLTALVTAGLFLLALFFSPIFSAIPSFATAPALIVVGVYMMQSVNKIDFGDFTEAVPAFLTIVMMPLAYSISWGLVFGVLSYVLLKLLTGRQKELNLVVAVIALLFVLKLGLG